MGSGSASHRSCSCGKGLLADKIEAITAAFEELIAAHGGAEHEGEARLSVAPFLNHSPYLCTLLDDPRIDGIARGLCGEDYQYWNSDGNYYVDETRWHSDGSSWSEHEQRNIDRDEPFFFFKLALYLDPLDGESGALRLIPGSHLVGDAYADGLQEQLTAQRSEDDAALSPLWQGAALPAHVCCTQPGDVVSRTALAAFSVSSPPVLPLVSRIRERRRSAAR